MAKQKAEHQCQYCTNWNKDNVSSSTKLRCWCDDGRGYKEKDEGKNCKSFNILPGYELRGGCFITTAVVLICGMQDNCRIMKDLRKLRTKLKRSKKGQELLKMYDVVGPQIASKIASEEEPKLVGYRIISEDLIPTATAVENLEYTKAAQRYLDMVNRLANRYEISMNPDDYVYDSTVTPNEMGHGTARVNKISVNK